MSKIKVAVTSAVVIAGLAALVIEMHTNEKLASTLANQRERLVLLSASDRLPSSPLFASVRTATDNHSAQELAQLQARIVELRNRPDGVVNAEIKPRSTWKDAGHATPEAALETFMWAATNRNFDTLASSYVFGEKSKAEAGAFFATLSPQVQARYGTPERLLAPYIVSHPTKSEVDAMQPIDVDDGGRSDEVVVRYWVHLADGSSHVDTLPFQHVNGEWRMGSRRMGISIPEAVDYIHTHVDPAIGP